MPYVNRAPPNTWTIYAALDPRTGIIRYIGQTKQTLEARVRSHLKGQDRHSYTHKNNWLNQLQAQELTPKWLTLDSCSSQVDADLIERECIRFYNELGCRLTNCGTIARNRTPKPDRYGHSDETRHKMSLSKKGIKLGPQSKEHIAKRMASHIGAKRSLETCRKISERAKGKTKHNWAAKSISKLSFAKGVGPIIDSDGIIHLSARIRPASRPASWLDNQSMQKPRHQYWRKNFQIP